jgi:molybdopterin molybdotransferase
MITFDEAYRHVSQLAVPLGSEHVALAEAAGRVLAAAVTARLDAPRFDQSVMDGYAVRNADLPGRLTVIGESLPGAAFAGTVLPGTCVRILTGAPVPAGADRVVIQEIVERNGDLATIAKRPEDGACIRPVGADFRAGEVLLNSGQHLSARAMVAAAAADVASLEVFRRPRIAILATGDELTEPGKACSNANAVPESVSFGIAALVDDWGGEIVGVRRLRDELDTLKAAAREALGHADLVVVTGGASVGDRDFAQAMFAGPGLETIFSKVAMKPGKPVWLARSSGRLVIGLPGNPTSAMVTGRLLLAPLVAGMAGRSGAAEWMNVPLAGPLPATGDRETFMRAYRTEGGAVPVTNQDSGSQSALIASDLLIRCAPNSPSASPGTEVPALRF